MKRLRFEDHHGQPGSCRYVIGQLGDKAAVVVVVVQPLQSEGSLSSRIELMAGKVPCSDLTGRSPDEVRFFEQCPAELKRIAAWREVIFQGAAPLHERAGLLAKLRRLFAPGHGLESWVVDRPVWRAPCRRSWRCACKPCWAEVRRWRSAVRPGMGAELAPSSRRV